MCYIVHEYAEGVLEDDFGLVLYKLIIEDDLFTLEELNKRI